MKRFIRECIWVIVALLLVALHLSVIQSVFLFYPIVQLILVAALVLCLIERPYRALEIGAIGGYLLDLFSGFPFGVFLLSMCVSIGVMLLLQKNVFKNKAMHAVALNTSFATAAFHLSWMSGLFILNRFSSTPYSVSYQHAFTMAGFQIIIHVVLASLIVMLFGWINSYAAKSV